MPSAKHDGLVELIRRDPSLACDLAQAGGVALPAHDEEAMSRPHLAALSAAAQVGGPQALDAVRLALEAAELLRDETSIVVRYRIFAVLDDALRLALTQDSAMQNDVSTSDIMRKWHAEAVEEGMRKGIEALRHALEEILVARRLVVTAAIAERIATIDDQTMLQRWVVRAATATTIDEVFAD